MVTKTPETQETERLTAGFSKLTVSELAALAREFSALSEEVDGLRNEAHAKVKAINEAREQAIKDLAEWKREALGPKTSRLALCRRAMSEIKAQHVPRELVTAESNARVEVNRKARELKLKAADLEKAQELYKSALRANRGAVSDELKRDVAFREELVGAAKEALKAASIRWEELRGELDGKLEELLGS